MTSQVETGAPVTGAMTQEPPAVRITGLSKEFGSVVALHYLDLELAAGEFVTMLGPSGCGKTTTLRIVAGLERATTGRVELFGKPIVDVDKGIFVPPHRRALSMVFQSYALWPHMTVLQNVTFPLNKRGRDQGGGSRQGSDRDLAMAALERVHCAHLASRFPGEISGGQQQRVALARAIVTEPRLVLLDEPLSNLDASLRKDLRVQLRLLQQDVGFAALYVTHDQQEALAMSDRVVLMKEGLVEQVAEPRQLFSTPRTTFAAGFIGDHNIIRGTVTGVADGRVSLDSPIGPLVARPSHDGLRCTIGARVVVAVRADRIMIGPVDQKPGGAVGTVVSTSYGGAHDDLRVEVDGMEGSAEETVTVRDYSGATTFGRGDRVKIRVRVEPTLTEVLKGEE